MLKKRLQTTKYQQKVNNVFLKETNMRVHIDAYDKEYVVILSEDTVTKIKEIIANDNNTLVSVDTDYYVENRNKVISSKDGRAINVNDIKVGDYIQSKTSFSGQECYGEAGEICRVIQNFGFQVVFINPEGKEMTAVEEEIDNFIYLGEETPPKKVVKKQNTETSGNQSVNSSGGFPSGGFASESVDSAIESIGMYNY